MGLIEAIWILSGSNVLVGKRQFDAFIVEGDYIIDRKDYRSTYGPAKPVEMTICHYWTGLRVKEVPGFKPDCPAYWRSP